MAIIKGSRQRPFNSNGVPSGNFKGEADKGALAVDTSTGVVYVNTGTLAAPTWTVVGSQA